MCTFILAWRAFPDTPIVVAANRDEATDRPSSPPQVFDRDPVVIAPRDERAGGTWIGYNEHGVLAAVTNRWTDAALAGERSRGLLVGDALEADAAEAAVRAVEDLVEADEYAGFNLVIADPVAAFLLEWDGRLRITPFDPGIHIVVNVGADGRFDVPESRAEAGGRQAANARRALAELQPEPGETAGAWLDRTTELIRDHGYGFCVHGEGFGTRSASLITIDAAGEVVYRFADGPPCETDFTTVADARPVGSATDG